MVTDVSDVLVGSLDLEQLGARSGSASVLVGVEDFLSREINVEIENQDGRLETLIAITFSGFNDPVTIEPPEEYEDISTPQDPIAAPTPLGGAAVGPLFPPSPSAVLYGFDKDWDDNILAHFSDAVHVYGAAELQVLDSDGRGWSLPLLHGSGTSSLTFDAHAEGKPAITLGETTVVGFVFLEADAELVDDNGQPVDSRLRAVDVSCRHHRPVNRCTLARGCHSELCRQHRVDLLRGSQRDRQARAEGGPGTKRRARTSTPTSLTDQRK